VSKNCRLWIGGHGPILKPVEPGRFSQNRTPETSLVGPALCNSQPVKRVRQENPLGRRDRRTLISNWPDGCSALRRPPGRRPALRDANAAAKRRGVRAGVPKSQVDKLSKTDLISS
jgi:hypothetical protein